jgi:hypothetical protein
LQTASPAAHCSPVHIAGNPLSGVVATFDYKFFCGIAPVAQKRLFSAVGTMMDARHDRLTLTNGLVRERTIRPQLIRIFCKLILRTGVTLDSKQQHASNAPDSHPGALEFESQVYDAAMRQTFRTVSQVLDGPRNARTYSRQRKLASFCVLRETTRCLPPRPHLARPAHFALSPLPTLRLSQRP